MRRSVFSVGFALIMPLLVMSMSPGTAFAATHTSSHTSQVTHHKAVPAKTRIDLQHGVPVPAFPATGSSKKGPDIALWREGCSNNIAYFMWFDVNGQWRDTFSRTDGNVQVTVFYMWCPRWPGDGVGLNFAGGTAQPINRCALIDLGNFEYTPYGGSTQYGASLIWPSDGYVGGDGNGGSQVFLCPGSRVTDWSRPFSGSGQYIATFQTSYWIPDSIYTTSGSISVYTPWAA